MIYETVTLTGNRLLGVCLDVKNTILDALDRTILVLWYVIMVHPLVGLGHDVDLVLEDVGLVSQTVPHPISRSVSRAIDKTHSMSVGAMID